MTKHSILILNGPNLNLLGSRQPEIYGTQTLADIETLCKAKASALGVSLTFEQTNYEGVLIDSVQKAKGTHHGIIINAAGYSHTSVALLDSLLASALPVLEVHLSNIYRRDDFRATSFISRVAIGVISGLGAMGYTVALDYLADYLAKNKA